MSSGLMVAQPRSSEPRIEELQDLVEDLRGYLNGSTSRFEASEFAELFNKAQGVLELTDEEVADRLSVSRPTVGRWSRGETAPHPIARPGIFLVLADIAKDKLKVCKSRRRQASAA